MMPWNRRPRFTFRTDDLSRTSESLRVVPAPLSSSTRGHGLPLSAIMHTTGNAQASLSPTLSHSIITANL